MCRSIKTLRRPGETATTGELEAAARQYVRKLSGFREPSVRNREAFDARGPGFVPPLWDRGLVTGIHQVSTVEAREMTRRLAREEALFGGTSSGANVAAALRVAERLGPGATVATLICDSGLKYLSTDLYATR